MKLQRVCWRILRLVVLQCRSVSLEQITGFWAVSLIIPSAIFHQSFPQMWKTAAAPAVLSLSHHHQPGTTYYTASPYNLQVFWLIFLKKPKELNLPADKRSLGRRYLCSGCLKWFYVWISPAKWHYQEREYRSDRFHHGYTVLHRVIPMSWTTLSTSYPQRWITRLTLDLHID